MHDGEMKIQDEGAGGRRSAGDEEGRCSYALRYRGQGPAGPEGRTWGPAEEDENPRDHWARLKIQNCPHPSLLVGPTRRGLETAAALFEILVVDSCRPPHDGSHRVIMALLSRNTMSRKSTQIMEGRR